MEQIFTALDSTQLAGGVFLDVTKKRHLIPLIILPYVINWLSVVQRLKLSHGSNQSSANWTWLLETLTLQACLCWVPPSCLQHTLMTGWLTAPQRPVLTRIHMSEGAAGHEQGPVWDQSHIITISLWQPDRDLKANPNPGLMWGFTSASSLLLFHLLFPSLWTSSAVN